MGPEESSFIAIDVSKIIGEKKRSKTIEETISMSLLRKLYTILLYVRCSCSVPARLSTSFLILGTEFFGQIRTTS